MWVYIRFFLSFFLSVCVLLSSIEVMRARGLLLLIFCLSVNLVSGEKCEMVQWFIARQDQRALTANSKFECIVYRLSLVLEDVRKATSFTNCLTMQNHSNHFDCQWRARIKFIFNLHHLFSRNYFILFHFISFRFIVPT